MSEKIKQLEPPEPALIVPEAVKKLNRDLRNAARTLGIREARYFVDTYYSLQNFRIRSSNQYMQLSKGEEPSELTDWLILQMETLENQIKAVLDKWSNAQPMGQWARSVVGIGPVISAGLLAHIDITKAPTVGHIWRFAGLDPTCKWEKGQKRPWNASLKRLCWLIGESFVKVSSHKNDVYGKLYLQRKEYEFEKNVVGDYADQAKKYLDRIKKKDADSKLLETLKAGKLPQAGLHERAKRWSVKLFLAHWHEVAYRQYYRTEPPKPYPIAILGHAHKIEPAIA